MRFALLADHSNTIPLIASWYFDEWGHLGRFTSRKELENRLQDALNREEIPLMILAFDNDDLAGVAELKYHEMDIYPDKDHWLGGIYVPAQHRGFTAAPNLRRHASTETGYEHQDRSADDPRS